MLVCGLLSLPPLNLPCDLFRKCTCRFFPPQVPEFMRFSVSFRVYLSLISFGAASNHLQISYQRIIPQRYHILILLLRHPIQSCNCTHNNPHEIRVIPLNSDHKILHIAGLLESTRHGNVPEIDHLVFKNYSRTTPPTIKCRAGKDERGGWSVVRVIYLMSAKMIGMFWYAHLTFQRCIMMVFGAC